MAFNIRSGLALVLGAALALPAASAIAQCADPRGAGYCTNNGQVTFGPPPSQGVAPAPPPANGATSPAVQSNAPASSNASISVDPARAPAGATVTLSGQGLGGGRSAWVNLAHMVTGTGLTLGAKQLATVNTAPDGTLTATLTIPSVPSWTSGQADICVINAAAQPVCTAFTLASADQAAINTSTTPSAVVGHYQCSSAVLIGFGGGWCTGAEPILDLEADGTYSFGVEQGNWSFDGSSVSFDGGLDNGAVLNRKLTVDTTIDAPDGSGQQEVRYTYIRMDY
ncbi:MAG: hypothetical protein NVSMB2_03710 [Chloroflexota bacterium]